MYVFVYSEMSLFPGIFGTIISAFSLYRHMIGEYVVRSFLPIGVFLPCAV